MTKHDDDVLAQLRQISKSVEAMQADIGNMKHSLLLTIDGCLMIEEKLKEIDELDSKRADLLDRLADLRHRQLMETRYVITGTLKPATE